MKLTFIQGGSRWKYDNAGNVYTDGNFNNSVWCRYKTYCEELRVILREENSIYTESEASTKYNKFDTTIAQNVAVPDIYQPRKNIFDIKLRRQVDRVIEREIKETDCVIIRSLGNIYTNTALKYARRYKKPYMVEVTGFIWEGTWYHSLLGKFVAFPKEYSYKKMMRNVPFSVYVTDEALQKRYPCKEMYGCSDVELLPCDNRILEQRIERIRNHDSNSKIIIGTAAFLDVGWKGQSYVIKAVKKLCNQGYNIEYQLIGGGSGKKLQELIQKLEIEDNVKILGTLPHEKVFKWLDSIDLYVQPSFQEGLCRAIVEALSRACPVIASDVGGNYELVPHKHLFKKGNVNKICDSIIEIIDYDNMIESAKTGFQKAKRYEKESLDARRTKIYDNFFFTSQR